MTSTGIEDRLSFVPRLPKRARRLLAAKKKFPGATQADLAQVCGCTPQNVSAILKRYGQEKEIVDAFRDNKADVWYGLSEAIIKTIDLPTIERAGLRDRMVSAAIADDKAVRAEGKATHVVDVRSLELVAHIDAREVQILQAALAHNVRDEEQDQ